MLDICWHTAQQNLWYYINKFVCIDYYCPLLYQEYWLKIKKMSANEVNSDSKYSKNSFNKILKSNFGNVPLLFQNSYYIRYFIKKIHKNIEKTLKRIKKQLAKNPVLVAKAFESYGVKK